MGVLELKRSGLQQQSSLNRRCFRIFSLLLDRYSLGCVEGNKSYVLYNGQIGGEWDQ